MLLAVPDVIRSIERKDVNMMWRALLDQCGKSSRCVVCLINEYDRNVTCLREYATMYESAECLRALQPFFDQLARPSPSHDDLRCAICQELLWNPLSCFCHHHYCRTCFHLSRVLGNVRACPLCRDVAAPPLGYKVNPILVAAIQRWCPADDEAMTREVASVRASNIDGARFTERVVALDTILEFLDQLTADIVAKPVLDNKSSVCFGFDVGDGTNRDIGVQVGLWEPDAQCSSLVNNMRGHYIEMYTMLVLHCTSVAHQQALKYAMVKYGNSLALALGGRIETLSTRREHVHTDAEWARYQCSVTVLYRARITVRASTTVAELCNVLQTFLNRASVIHNMCGVLVQAVHESLLIPLATPRLQTLCTATERWLSTTVFSQHCDELVQRGGSDATLDVHQSRWHSKVLDARARASAELPSCTAALSTAMMTDSTSSVQVNCLYDTLVSVLQSIATRLGSSTSVPVSRTRLYTNGYPLFIAHAFQLDAHVSVQYDCRHSVLLLLRADTKPLDTQFDVDNDVFSNNAHMITRFFDTRNQHHHFESGDTISYSNHIIDGRLHAAVLHCISLSNIAAQATQRQQTFESVLFECLLQLATPLPSHAIVEQLQEQHVQRPQ
jgi:hypothetical protein